MLVKLFSEIQKSYIATIQNGTQMFGRLPRREFWLFYGSGYAVLAFISISISYKMHQALKVVPLEMYPDILQSFSTLLLLAGGLSLIFQVVALPSMVRRFQDTDRKALACHVYVALQLATFPYQAALANGIALPQFITLVFGVITIPSFALTLYVLFVLCLKGCDHRNSFGLQAEPACASSNSA